MTTTAIEQHPTFVADVDGRPAGWCQIIPSGPGTVTLEHLWVDPARMGQRIGRRLLGRALKQSAARGATCLEIDSDTHAEGFYLACGAIRTGEVSAPTANDPHRVRPQLSLATTTTPVGE